VRAAHPAGVPEEALAEARRARGVAGEAHSAAESEEALALAARCLRGIGLRGAERDEVAALADPSTLPGALEAAEEAADPEARARLRARARVLARDAVARREVEERLGGLSPPG
jgi:hypothetical protein